MSGSNYIQLQNQGNIMSNIRLLYEMLNSDGYADEHGYFTKADVADIASNALIITTGSKVGDEVASVIHEEGDESLNSPLQNAKARMQLLRVLGLVSCDYDSEIYAVTRLGKLIVSQVLSPNPDMSLLRELFLHISSSSEIYDHNCELGFNCMLGYGIMYAFAKLDYKITTDEMPLLTAYDITDIDLFVLDAKKYRQSDSLIPNTHPYFPKTKRLRPLKNVSNLTRSINQILKTCGIIHNRVSRIGNKNYYVCTEKGIKFVDSVTSRFDKLEFITGPKFRKYNSISKQKELVLACYKNILVHGNIEDSSEYDRRFQFKVFSPFQMIPETNVEWLLGGTIRSHPVLKQSNIVALNSQIRLHDLRVKELMFNSRYSVVEINPLDESLSRDILEKYTAGMTVDEIASSICESYKQCTKDFFYPFVHSLLRIIGLECVGEVGRFDALCHFDYHDIPFEIKTYGESPSYNLKGLRQSIENKIMCYNGSLADDMEYATFVVGYNHPNSENDVRDFIDLSYDNFGIKIIATDIKTLAKISIKILTESKSIDLNVLLKGRGLLKD